MTRERPHREVGAFVFLGALCRRSPSGSPVGRHHVSFARSQLPDRIVRLGSRAVIMTSRFVLGVLGVVVLCSACGDSAESPVNPAGDSTVSETAADALDDAMVEAGDDAPPDASLDTGADTKVESDTADAVAADTADSSASDTADVSDTATALDTAVDTSDTGSSATDGSSDTADAYVDVAVDTAPDPCEAPLACPTASDGKTHVCGTVFDLKDSTRLTGSAASAVEVTFFDVLGLVASTPTTRPTPLARVTVDSCGRFTTAATSGVPIPASGMAIAVDDRAGATADDFVFTFVGDNSGASRISGVRAFALRSTTDASWSTAAGLTPSIGARGALLAIFLDPSKPGAGPFPGKPMPSVQITQSGLAKPASDFYFSDSGALSRLTLAPTATSTGPNGSALFLEPTFAPYGGDGGDCTWDAPTLSASAGMVFVREIKASVCY